MVPTLTLIYDRKGQASPKKAAVVELRISAGRTRSYISTGVKLFPSEWSNGSVIGRKDWKELNDQLQVLKRKCSEIITKMMDDGCLDIKAVPNLLKDGIIEQETFIDYAKDIAKRRLKNIAEGTQKHYDVFFKFLDNWKGLVFFADVTERNILKMDDELESRGLKECTRWNYHKLMKSFILQAIDDGHIKKNPYGRLDIRRGNENGLTRFLTPEEFHRFENCIIPIERLQKVRDLFVFQTYTMMSYSDLAAFDYKKCTKIKGQVVYKSKRQKTKQDFTIVILEPALNILKRYKNRLPIISNVKYNEYLKAAVIYAKIDKMVTTHWARHTGATLLLNEGVPMQIIQHILGHASIRETEKTYAKLLDSSIVDAMVEYRTKKA